MLVRQFVPSNVCVYVWYMIQAAPANFSRRPVLAGQRQIDRQLQSYWCGLACLW